MPFMYKEFHRLVPPMSQRLHSKTSYFFHGILMAISHYTEPVGATFDKEMVQICGLKMLCFALV